MNVHVRDFLLGDYGRIFQRQAGFLCRQPSPAQISHGSLNPGRRNPLDLLPSLPSHWPPGG